MLIKIETTEEQHRYNISVGSNTLSSSGKWAQKCLGHSAQRVVIVSNDKVFGLYGETVERSLADAGFAVTVWKMRDGERFKDLRSLDAALDSFAAAGLTRTDAVVALGGGVVGDLAGFAASIYLRGISFLQIPTTLLAMIDSSVGGKTGINSKFGKNTIGAFYQPKGVLIDPDLLATLDRREMTAGFCEAIKQGAIGSIDILGKVEALLEKFPIEHLSDHFGDPKYRRSLAAIVADQVAFKAGIVSGDQRESAARRDRRSRKILNFGHTLAHALEKVTDYKYFRHGEAVGYGIIYAAELSKELALSDENVVKLLNDVVHRSGTLPKLDNIDPKLVIEAFRFDKKQVAGSLQMVLLQGIGKPVIISGDDIPLSAHLSALKRLIAR
ncbi:MAG: 3-dehydroquinate synthase [Chloracidobacterium sp.]|nr:3-dehydroquinate synthase [Chloracidobacterium sp.]